MLRWVLLQCWQRYFQTAFTKLSSDSKWRASLLFWHWRQSVLISVKSPLRWTDQRFCHAAYQSRGMCLWNQESVWAMLFNKFQSFGKWVTYSCRVIAGNQPFINLICDSLIDRTWPIFACHAAIFTVDSMSVSGLIPDSWGLGRCCRRNCLCHVKKPLPI